MALPEPDWERADKTSSTAENQGALKWGVAALLLILSLFIVGLLSVKLLGQSGRVVDENTQVILPIEPQQEEEEDEITQFIRDAQQVARSFVSDLDEKTRLTLVRDVENVSKHLGRYPEDARTFSIESIKLTGYSERDGRRRCAYAVRLTNGNARLLNVIETDAGLKVDWDSYARYCSASWDDLVSGEVVEAEVRVFVMPGDHPVKPFDDTGRWMCFQLAEAGSDRVFYGYAHTGSELARKMLAAIMKNRSSRQHMTLKISSDGKSCRDRLFMVDALLAMGWVRE